ncbi:MAG: DUF1778 domain-containing protein [Candidatus Obscuribacterales bacterium]|nr:DUF1778 domain-containing protein [Candidatus Obscuribacterales bacterium]
MARLRKERIGLRVTEEQKALIEQAALIKQKTVSSFIMEAAFVRAQKVIRQYSDVYLTNTDWRLLRQALEGTRPGPSVRKILNRKAYPAIDRQL